MTGLYFHIPFCKSKCPYCDFYSLSYKDYMGEAFAEAVIRNIKHYSDKFGKLKIDTVYFGGGTPTMLGISFYERIFNAIRQHFTLSEDAEISLEANPVTINPQLMADLLRVGFNRISIGVQSMVDSELKILGRLHNSERAEEAILCAYNSGFKNISADLMLGIIDQNENTLVHSVESLAKLPVNHISAYILKIEEGTAYSRERFRSRVPDDDTQADLYLKAVETLADNGFAQYEISNFSKPDYECKHNIIYWNSDDYIGIGPSAHSYFKGRRYAVPRDLKAFCDNGFQNEILTDNDSGTFEEYAMLKIRLMTGIDLDECVNRFEINKDAILQKAHILQKNNLVKINKSTISLTPSGCLVSNEIICRLFL